MNFTGTNTSKTRKESKIPNGSKYLTQLSIFKKKKGGGNRMRDMQNHTIIKVGKDLQDHQVQLSTHHHQNPRLYFVAERLRK